MCSRMGPDIEQLPYHKHVEFNILYLSIITVMRDNQLNDNYRYNKLTYTQCLTPYMCELYTYITFGDTNFITNVRYGVYAHLSTHLATRQNNQGDEIVILITCQRTISSLVYQMAWHQTTDWTNAWLLIWLPWTKYNKIISAQPPTNQNPCQKIITC